MWHHSFAEFLQNLLVFYLSLTFVLTVYSVVKMYWINHKANDVKYGIRRIRTLQMQGRWKELPLYSLEEMSENKALGTVRLSVFEQDSGQRKKCMIICPGGGYAHCVTKAEGYAIAAKANELGYTALVLEYRTRFSCSPYAPMEDLGKAVDYLFAHQDELNVDPEGYAVCGFSAGGNLAALFGSHAPFGYEKYGVAKPGALILGYPWTNINHWMDHPYWNVWKVLIEIWLSERGALYMFGRKNNKKNRETLCVQNWIAPDYPPVYMFSGGNDVLVSASHHADVTEHALKEHHVPHVYQKYFRLPHGIGLGVGTAAEGWMEEAIAFWLEHVGEQG